MSVKKGKKFDKESNLELIDHYVHMNDSPCPKCEEPMCLPVEIYFEAGDIVISQRGTEKPICYECDGTEWGERKLISVILEDEEVQTTISEAISESLPRALKGLVL